ncbi:MAG: PilN domain-containing protein [Candidatus Omnitrophota bacterium]
MLISINLLPKSQRKTEHKVVLPYKTVFLGTVLFLLFVHVCLLLVAGYKQVQILGLQSRWSHMSSGSKDSVAMRKEIKDLEANTNSLNGLLYRRASVTELLSGLNAAVPKGLWLERFTYGDDGLLIQGSVVSLTQNEMTIIGKFLQDLKNNKLFISLFSKIELSSVSRRTIKTYDVVDFVFSGEFK